MISQAKDEEMAKMNKRLELMEQLLNDEQFSKDRIGEN